jgi:hypothetical protein
MFLSVFYRQRVLRSKVAPNTTWDVLKVIPSLRSHRPDTAPAVGAGVSFGRADFACDVEERPDMRCTEPVEVSHPVLAVRATCVDA